MKLADSKFSSLPLVLTGISALILLGIIFLSTYLASETARLSGEVTRSRIFRTVASDELSTLLNAETGQRGYLLTANEAYLAPYLAARREVSRTQARLFALDISGSDNFARHKAEFRSIVAAKLDELDRTVELARHGQRAQALAIVNGNRGKNYMDRARVILNGVIADSETRVARNIENMNRNAALLQTVSLAGGVLVALFAAIALWLLLSYIREAVRARSEVERLNTSLEEKVLQRTEALTRANDEIQRFAYIVSHDLRAPLVNIMGFTSELEVGATSLQQYFAQGEGADPAAAKEAATVGLPEAVRFIRSSTDKMDRLINAILRLSRDGRRELLPEPVNLNRVFENILASVKHQIEDTGTVVTVSPALPTVYTDRLALEQVFGNLVDNALKYLQPGRTGQLSIAAQDYGTDIVIAIRDNGRGIAERDYERIFELFRRAGRQDKAGEGIGLAHVRSLARRLGGDVTLVSKIGEGSEFRVSLPRSLPTEIENRS
jgi:signal transduction histidine kinase